jgi:hypothetical protein
MLQFWFQTIANTLADHIRVDFKNNLVQAPPMQQKNRLRPLDPEFDPETGAGFCCE